jgi:hypothetical protein
VQLLIIVNGSMTPPPHTLLGLLLLIMGSESMTAPAPCLPAPTLGAQRLFTTAENYAVFTIDTSRNRLFFNANFSDARLAYLTAQIGGGPVRVGGGGGDLLSFATLANNTACDTLPARYECLNATTFDALLGLSAHAHVPVVFGLNLLPDGVGPSKPWDPTNARALLAFARDHAALPLAGIELGNEQNSYGFLPAQQAAAFHVLAGVVADVFPAGARPPLVGPDADGAHGPAFYNSSTAKLCAYLEAFVLGTNGILSAVTYHEYPELTNVTVLEPAYLDAAAVNAAAVVAAVRLSNATIPVWAGEIGPHTGDSPPNSLVAACNNNGLCGRFGSALWYADALGGKARVGTAAFFRQDLVGGTYALINTSTPDGSLFGDFTPSPDYYLLWVWQRTVGSGVLSLALPAAAPPTLRAYAFCARGAARALALVFINVGNASSCVAVPAAARAGAPLTRYAFTAGDAGGVGSWSVRLNGALLRLAADGSLPQMDGTVVPAAGGITVLPLSVLIVTVPTADSFAAC